MKKGCLISSILVFALLSAGLIYYFYQNNKKDPVIYEYVKPEKGDIEIKAVTTGSIKPRKEVNIKPQVSGVIDRLFVEAGDKVTKGQNIARIKLVPSQVNINNAQSGVELSKLRYQDAKRELDRQRSVSSGNLDITQAKSRYDNAVQEEQRQKNLFEDGVISEKEYQQAQLNLQLEKNSYDNAKISSSNTLQQFVTEVDIRRQEMNAAINNLQLLREGATQNSSQVSNIIKSTVDGMVLEVPVEEGSSVIERNNFNEGTTVASVADMSTLIFEGTVDESDVGKIKQGMPLVLTVGALNETSFNGVLEFISPKGNLEEGSVKFMIRAAIKDDYEDAFLRAGYSANADIILDKKTDLLVVNERDVIYRNDSTFVELVTGDQEFSETKVELGISDGIIVEVVGGLSSEDEIKLRSDPNNN